MLKSKKFLIAIAVLFLLSLLPSCGGGGGSDDHASMRFTQFIVYKNWRGGWSARGIVENTGDRRADYARVSVDLYGRNGDFLENVARYVNGTHVNAKATDTFDLVSFGRTPIGDVGSYKAKVTWHEF